MTYLKREYSRRQQMLYQQTVLNKNVFELPFKNVQRHIRCPQIKWQTVPHNRTTDGKAAISKI